MVAIHDRLVASADVAQEIVVVRQRREASLGSR
jgi:hypothetical protein